MASFNGDDLSNMDDINSSFSSNDKKIFQRMHKQHQIVFVIIIMGANIF
jgi:hypothetical protein